MTTWCNYFFLYLILWCFILDLVCVGNSMPDYSWFILQCMFTTLGFCFLLYMFNVINIFWQVFSAWSRKFATSCFQMDRDKSRSTSAPSTDNLSEVEQDDEDEVVVTQAKPISTSFFFCHQSKYQRHLLQRLFIQCFFWPVRAILLWEMVLWFVSAV